MTLEKSVTNSVRKKLVLMAVSTTFFALLAASLAMSMYDMRSFQQSWVDDLRMQAEILAVVSSPAIAFNDPKAAQENLGLLKVRPRILTGAIYTGNGARFASYAKPNIAKPEFPIAPKRPGYTFDGTELVIYHPIIDNGERIGTIYLRAQYELLERLTSYAGILAAVMAGSLVIAALVASRLQKIITQPILAVANVAHQVMKRRDFSLRAPKTTSDEIGVLVDAFNSMLIEVGKRAQALEESNRTLQNETHIRAQAEAALLAADRRKDEFLATLAHELRNPLAPISTGLAIMRMSGGDSIASLRARDIMERQLKQMVRLVDDLLDVSRITTGKLMIQKDQVELQQIVNNAIEIVRPLIESQEHALSVDIPAEPIMLQADATRLAQVLSNLLNNAAKYTKPGGKISLSAALENDQVVIRITDNGIGISADMLARVFDMFTQVDYSLERTNAGLGVGLSLARRLVELHDGTIRVYSEGPGCGCQFEIRLAASAAAPAASQAESDVKATDTAYRILLADDNLDFVTSMGGLLRALGHTVHITHDGEQALAAAWFHPDFAFLDIGLPKLNGYDLARALRQSPATRQCILTAVTGWGQDKDRQRAFEAGFDHHMVKPVDLEQIRAILQRHGIAG